jgi:hypothetical protein
VTDLVFDGWIVGLGTDSGYRFVVGCWPQSPYGPVADVMVEGPQGDRVLLAPSREVADFIAATYTFDAVRVVAVSVDPLAADVPGRVHVVAGEAELVLVVEGRTPVGRLLRLVPRVLSRRLWWVWLIDRPARLVVPGVRTVGSAGGGRREWYSARDNRSISLVSATWEGHRLGGLTGVVPPVRFGFGSTPRRPSWTRVTTTVRVPSAG